SSILIPRPPPTPPLFPYTTLFRSHAPHRGILIPSRFSKNSWRPWRSGGCLSCMRLLFIGGTGNISAPCAEFAHRLGHEVWLVNRSEEHTSELQSLRHLVCRLLLEK